MRYLIDTHVCLWIIGDKNKLSAKVKAILEKEGNRFYLSQISLLEIAIKLQTGKLVEVSIPLSKFIDKIYATGFEIMPFKDEHIVAYSTFDFPAEHRDPFDRYLAATAYFEEIEFITKDAKFQLYTNKLKILW
jgi:PIN domain nuclease of toxin-antitoxin system